MTHLLTIASQEAEDRNRWHADDDLPEHFPRNEAPHGLKLGDIGSMYLFTCTACPDRPLGGDTQW